MLGFSISELMLIGLVAALLIGPKDIPVALRALIRLARKIQRIKGELRSQIDGLVREADFASLSKALTEAPTTPLMAQGTGSVSRGETMEAI